MVALVLPDLAFAQAVPRGEAARGSTVANRPRADFDPLGIRLDGWRLDAAVEAGGGYDTNLLGTKNNKLSDGYASLLGEASLNSDWSRHAIGVNGRIQSRNYFQETALDWLDYAVGGFGRYDVNADTNLELRLNRVQEHLETSNVDVQSAGLTEPVPYYYNEAQLSGTTRFNRLGVTVLGNFRSYKFENVESGTTPGSGQVDQLDFNSAIGAVGLAYFFAPGRSIDVIGRYQDISYENSINSGRDSKTWEILGGFTYDFDGVWAARIAVGYRQRDYRAPGLQNLSGPAFEATLTWQPTLLTTVGFSARRTIEESIRNNAVSYTRTLAQVNVDHEYLRNVILGAELGMDRKDYEQPDQYAVDGYAGVSARWLINRNLALVGSYQYVRRINGSAGFDDYDRNIFLLRLRAAL
jgi:hypothetical protein